MILSILGLVIASCNDDKDGVTPNPPPITGELTISNLTYDPKEIPIEENHTTFSITGNFNFINADGGPSKLKMTTSTGTDLTVDIQGNEGQKNGTITGYLEFVMPEEPAIYSFNVWLMDVKGRSSNILSGSINIVNDDRIIYWKKVSLPNESWKLNAITQTNAGLVSVGNNGLILTSTNAYDWNQQLSPTNVNLNSIYWSGSMFIAAGEFGIIITSPDGINWTLRHSSDNNIKLYDIESSGQLFVAVGRDSVNDKSTIFTSLDGFTWSHNPFTIDGAELKSIARSGNHFMAVGNKVDSPCCRTPQCICGYWQVVITSDDGLNWTDNSRMDSSIPAMSDVCWNNNNFIAAAGYRVASYNDGTLITYMDNTLDAMYRIVKTETKYIGLGLRTGTNLIYSSADGLNWYNNGQGQSLELSGIILTDLIYTGKKYVVVGPTGYIVVSPF